MTSPGSNHCACILLALVACAPDKGDTDAAATETGTAETGTAATSGDEPEPTTSGTTGTDPGTTTGVSGDTMFGGCKQTVIPLEYEEPAPMLGFSVKDAVEGLQGYRDGTLTWPNDGFVHADLKGKVWPLQVGLNTYMGPEYNYIQLEAVGGAEDGPTPDCQSRLEFGIYLVLKTEGGELEEQYEVTMYATELGTITLEDFVVSPLEFFGTLTPQQIIDPPQTLDSLHISLTVTADAADGALLGEVSDPMLGSVGFGTLAPFTAGAPG